MLQSRRKFLKTAAASGTLAAVSPTPAVAKQGRFEAGSDRRPVCRIARRQGLQDPRPSRCGRVNNIRNFVASAGLTATRVPHSTRALTAYLYGATDYDNVTWEQVLKLIAGPIVQPFLNDVQTLASSPDDMVSYYSRALLGDFFQHDETLDEFRRIQTLCDFIYLIPLPLGISAYAKSGNVDVRRLSRPLDRRRHALRRSMGLFRVRHQLDRGDHHRSCDRRPVLRRHQRFAVTRKSVAVEGLNRRRKVSSGCGRVISALAAARRGSARAARTPEARTAIRVRPAIRAPTPRPA